MALVLTVLVVVIATTKGADIELLDCEPPDLPKYGGYGPRHQSYTPGDVVHYFCDLDTHIGGNYYRRCEDTGAWSGDTPVCDKPSKFSNVTQTSTVPNGDARNAVDGFRTTCSQTQGGQREEWYGIFATPGQLIRVMLFLPMGQVSFEVVMLQANGQEVVCGSHTRNMDRYEWTFQNCAEPNNVGATGLKIRSLTPAPLQICEIQAHVLKSPKCVDPKVQIENGRIRLDRQTATLVCENGFSPSRERTLKCVREGVWNRKLLYCIERQWDLDERNKDDSDEESDVA